MNTGFSNRSKDLTSRPAGPGGPRKPSGPSRPRAPLAPVAPGLPVAPYNNSSTSHIKLENVVIQSKHRIGIEVTSNLKLQLDAISFSLLQNDINVKLATIRTVFPLDPSTPASPFVPGGPFCPGGPSGPCLPGGPSIPGRPGFP